MEALMKPATERERKQSWVEMTPLNAMRGRWLRRVFPEMRLIHMLRDGRDVAVSVAAVWKQMDPNEALTWWQRRMEQIATDNRELPEGSILRVELEDLVRDDRQGTYSRIIEFLELDDDPGMRKFFDADLVPEKANIGRWKSDLEHEEQESFTQRYEEILLELRDKEIPIPALDREHDTRPLTPPTH
jgi:hypothetical protein